MRQRGFSLLETLLTLILFGTVVVIVAHLLSGYQRILKHGSAKQRTLAAAQVALGEIRDEVKGALRILLPTTGTSPSIELEKLIPNKAGRLPTIVPVPPPANWNLTASGDVMTMRYEVNAQGLARTLLTGVPAGTFGIAPGINNLSARLQGNLLEVTLQVAESKVTKTLSTRIYRLR
jgi:prepilin-type N-terminal cleavage/methylation domain-containing protein